MAAIAGELNISPQALYWHFPSKDDLLYAYLHQALERTLEAFEAAVVGCESHTERLASIVRAHVRLELQGDDGQGYGPAYDSMLLSANLSGERLEELRSLHRQAHQVYRGVLSAGVKAGEFREMRVTTVAFAISSMCTAVQTWFRAEGSASVEEIADQYADISMGIVAPGSVRV